MIFISEFGVEEVGIDTGGLFKEFLSSLSQTVFNPHYGLFKLAETDNVLFPNPDAKSVYGIDDSIQYYEFIGQVLGKAMYESIVVDPRFAQFFLRKMLGKTNCLHELKSLDPELHKHLLFLRGYEGNLEDLCLYFAITEDHQLHDKKSVYNECI